MLLNERYIDMKRPMLDTLYDIFQNSIKNYADRTAYTLWGGEELTYGDVAQRVSSLQERLLAAGLNAGDKVALLSGSMPNWGIAYFAIVTAGLVAVPILPDFSGEELDMIVEHSESKALIVSDRLYTKLSKDTVDKLNVVIRVKNLAVISQRVKQQGRFAVPKPDDLAVIIYTSGTTSSPKGVMHTHYSLSAHILMCQGLFPIDENDVFLSVLPLSHTYECSIGLIYPFAFGASVSYLDRPPTASALLPALKGVRPTVMLIVPLIIEKIYRSQVQAKFNSNGFWRTICKVGVIRRYLHRVAGKKLMKVFGRRLRFLGVGGAKLDAVTEQFLLEARIPYAIGYGLTETAPLLAGASPDIVRLGSTGPEAPTVKLRLDNINPETQQGEIVALTPSVMAGYYKNPEATAECFTEDGWFRTGDLGCFDKDGFLYIRGRLKNMIVGPSGENIYPEDIESVLNTHIFVQESVVTQKEEGQLVALVHFDSEALEAKYAELRESFEAKRSEWERWKDEKKKEIMEYVNSKVNKFSRISDVVENDGEFEKTPTKKIKRFLYGGKTTANDK